MPVTVQDEVFEILPSPSWASPRIRKAPKIKFQAEGGYTHQRERYPSARNSYQLKWSLLSTPELATLENWLDAIGSSTFYFLPPTAMWGGTLTAGLRLMRVTSEEITITPLAYGWYAVEITVEEV